MIPADTAPVTEAVVTDSPAFPRSVVQQVLSEHRVYAFNGTETECACPRTRWLPNATYRAHVAQEVVAALMPYLTPAAPGYRVVQHPTRPLFLAADIADAHVDEEQDVD